GIVKLNSATDSTSTTEAATPSAVKAAYDLANGKAAGSHKHAWGDITDVPDGTTAQKGIVKLNSATNSTSTTEAATPSAVKAAYDLAKSKTSATNIYTRTQSDARYVQNVMLGAEVQAPTMAPAGCVITFVDGGDKMECVRYKPLQININGFWRTISG
ncbi:tail fiber protein, partial [Salmonella enterica]